MLDFDVEFYNNEERNKLKSIDCFSSMVDLVNTGLRAYKEEFLVYSIFREQKNHPGFRTYKDLKRKLPSRINAFQDYFDLSSGSVISKFAARHDKDNVKTEEAGVGAGLAIASHLYNLTEADWERLPILGMKHLDFQIASTGNKFIQVEAKGTVVNDANKSQNIYTHKADIVAKKDEQRDKQKNTNTLLGVITAFPSTDKLKAKCYLLDPPPLSIDFNPLKYKLLSRLYYYWRELSIVSRSHFLEVLINRICAITLIKDYEQLDSLPLLNLKGEPHPVPDSLFQTRSYVRGKEAFGEVIPIDNSLEMFFFYGFRTEVVETLLKQRFEKITAITFKPFVQEDVTVYAKIPANLLHWPQDNLDLEEDQDNQSRKKMRMKGDLTHTPSGRVLGLLRPREKLRSS